LQANWAGATRPFCFGGQAKFRPRPFQQHDVIPAKA
jgi:hypothetical protein